MFAVESNIRRMEGEFEKFLASLPLPSEKKDINSIVDKFPIPSSQLEGSAEEKTAWEEEKEVVEWAKNRTKQDSTVYYDYADSANTLTVLNIAALIPKGKLLLKCSS